MTFSCFIFISFYDDIVNLCKKIYLYNVHIQKIELQLAVTTYTINKSLLCEYFIELSIIFNRESAVKTYSYAIDSLCSFLQSNLSIRSAFR